MKICMTCKRMYGMERSFCSLDGQRLASTRSGKTLRLPKALAEGRQHWPELPANLARQTIVFPRPMMPSRQIAAFAVLGSIVMFAAGGLFFTTLASTV